jgi:hypothetical protein
VVSPGSLSNLFFLTCVPVSRCCQLVDIFAPPSLFVSGKIQMFLVFPEKEGKATVSVAVSTGRGLLSLTDGWHVQPLRPANALATCDVCGKHLARQSDMPRHKRLHDPKPERW